MVRSEEHPSKPFTQPPQPCGPPTCLTSLAPFNHSFTHSLIHSFSHSLICSFICLVTHACSHSFIHVVTHSVILSLIHSATHSFTHSLTFSQGLSAREHWRWEAGRGRHRAQSQLSRGPHPHLAPHLGNLNDVWNVQIGLHRGEPPADEVGFISFLSMHLARVLLRIDSHCADAQLRAGPEHADGDLAWGGEGRVTGRDVRPWGPKRHRNRGMELGQAPTVLTSVGHHDLLDGLVLQAPDVGRGSSGGGGPADSQKPQAPLDSLKLQHLEKEVRARLEQPHSGQYHRCLSSWPGPAFPAG